MSAENFQSYGIKLSLQEKYATHTIEVTINQHHWSKSSLIGERNHSAENQEGNSHAGNLNDTYLERRLQRKTLLELSLALFI